MSDKTKGYTKIRAVLGVTGVKKMIAKAIRRDIYFAESEEDAKEWIVKNSQK